MSDPDLRWATANEAQPSTVPPAPPAPPPVISSTPPLLEQGDDTTNTPKTEQARDEARHVASTAAEQTRQVATTAQEAGRHLAHDAREQAAELAGEAKLQVRNLADEARGQLRSQASMQTTRAADGLRTLAEQISALAEGRTDQAGMAGDFARQAHDRISAMASRLETGGIDGAMDDIRRFARRRPGTFLLGAAAAGFVVGRTLRGAQAASGDRDPTTSGRDVVDLTDDPLHFGGPSAYGDPTTYESGLSTSAVRSTPYDSATAEPLPPTSRPVL